MVPEASCKGFRPADATSHHNPGEAPIELDTPSKGLIMEVVQGAPHLSGAVKSEVGRGACPEQRRSGAYSSVPRT